MFILVILIMAGDTFSSFEVLVVQSCMKKKTCLMTGVLLIYLFLTSSLFCSIVKHTRGQIYCSDEAVSLPLLWKRLKKKKETTDISFAVVCGLFTIRAKHWFPLDLCVIPADSWPLSRLTSPQSMFYLNACCSWQLSEPGILWREERGAFSPSCGAENWN